MKKLAALTLLLSICTFSSAYASKEVGNGGNGLLLNGVPVVLDLVEAGVDHNPFFNDSVEINPLILAEIKKGLPRFPETHLLLAKKLSEIEKVSQPVAWALTESFRLFNIRIVNEALVNIHDDDSVVDYDPSIMLQLAIRRGTSIFINGTWWPKMSAEQKVALLVHEVVYAFQKTIKVQKGDAVDYVQVSTPARAITGFLFTTDLTDLGIQGLERVLYNQSRLEDMLKVKMKSPLVASEDKATSINILSQNASVFQYNYGPAEKYSRGEYIGEITSASKTADFQQLCNYPTRYLNVYSAFEVNIDSGDPRLGLWALPSRTMVERGNEKDGTREECLKTLTNIRDNLPK